MSREEPSGICGRFDMTLGGCTKDSAKIETPHSAGHPIIVSENVFCNVELMKRLSLRCHVTSGREDDAAGYDN
jgi:hypothetical protein